MKVTHQSNHLNILLLFVNYFSVKLFIKSVYTEKKIGLFKELLFLIPLCQCVCGWICLCECRCWEQSEAFDFPGAGVERGSEQLAAGLRNAASVLWKSSTYPEILSFPSV